jgi:uncharacterized membrane protein
MSQSGTDRGEHDARMAQMAQLSTRTALVAAVAILLVTVLASVLTQPSLPEEMVVQWNSDGQATNTASQLVGAFGIPALAAVLCGLFMLLPRIDPLGSNFAAFRGYYNGFVVLLVAFLAAMHGVILAVNLGYDVAIQTVVAVAVGVLLAYAGLLCRVAEPNWFVGIRTPWTLSSETVWRKTHDVVGILLIATGIIGVLVALLDATIGMAFDPTYVVAGGGVLAAVVSILYSFYLYGRLDKPDDAPS